MKIIPEEPLDMFGLDRDLSGVDLEAFCPISLGDWLKVCEKAGIPYVPAERVSELNREDMLQFDTEGDHHERLKRSYDAIRAAVLDGHMLRFDGCSSSEVKYWMGKGESAWRPEFNILMLDDPRVFDITFEYPRPVVPVWRRPWIQSLIISGYPVEYRAFVRDGEVVGISNYYPQRPLPEFNDHLSRVRQLTEQLIHIPETPFLWHVHSDTLAPEGRHFTADFIVTTDEEILFLEGGPPHEMGAHMCCFRPGEINGVALSDRNS